MVRALKRRHGSDMTTDDVRVLPLRDAVVGGARPPLVLLFAGACVLLLVAAAGVGTLLVARAEARRRELGVRVALGARAADVRRVVLGRGLAPAALGLAAGLAAALAVGRVLAAQLYGVRPADPATFAGVAAVLGAVAVAAAWAPARRSARRQLRSTTRSIR